MWTKLIRTLCILTVVAAVTSPLRSQDSGEPVALTAPPATDVETGGRVGSHVAIVSGADGLPLLAFYDETRGDLKVSKCLDASCSDRVATTTIDSKDSVGSYVAIAIDGEGLPVLSYLDATSGDLKIARCSAPDCSGTATVTRLDTAGVVGLFTSMAIGDDGLPVISYFDRDRCALKVAKCKDPACSGGDATISILDNKGCVGLFSSLAISADGTPVIAYYDSNKGRLKVAKCRDAACTEGKARISVVDESVSLGSFARLAIGANGLPLISYYDHSRGDLKLARCNDSACAGGDESIITLDKVGLVGSYGALALSEDERPIVAYYDPSSGLAKVVECRDQSCSKLGVPRVIAENEESMISFLAMTIRADGTAAIAYFNETDGDLELVSMPLAN